MMRRFVVPIAVVSILILLGGLTAGLVSAHRPNAASTDPDCDSAGRDGHADIRV